jgi:subfamily B ATP-binding cassette protein MsbA
VKRYFRILKLAFSYKLHAALNILFNFLFVLFNLGSLLLFIPFLKLLFNELDRVDVRPVWADSSIKDYFSDFFSYEMGQFIDMYGEQGSLIFICISVGTLFFLKNICRYLAMYFLAYIRIGVVRDIRGNLYDKVLRLPLSYYSDERKGDLIARLTNDVTEVEVSIMSTLELLFREPLAIVVTIGAMIIISPQLMLFSLVMLPVSGLIISRIGKSLKRTSQKGQSKMGELMSNLEETLGGLRIVKAFTVEDMFNKKFGVINDQYRKIMTKLVRKRDLASPASEFLGSLVLVALVWFGGSLVLDKTDGEPAMTGDAFIGFIVLFSQLMRPVQGVSTAYANINKGLAAVERIDEVMEAEVTITDKPTAAEKSSFEQRVEYKNVSFAYGNEPVLQNIDLTVTKGQTIALVGESGGGKSTMADLLPRFYDVTEGQICIDGTDLRDLKVKDLRGLMGIVSQKSILFNDTVFANIDFGTGASEQEVIEAAKIANAHEFIDALEKGYQTNIGDGGGKLSGGQQQRLSIARAVLKNPPILILDEATSALDTESERLVQDALYKLMENRTSLVIAHRLSTIQHADEIIVLQKGKIMERGSHQELLDKQGIYKKLHALQSFV